jgi:hypothetical protein
VITRDAYRLEMSCHVTGSSRRSQIVARDHSHRGTHHIEHLTFPHTVTVLFPSHELRILPIALSRNEEKLDRVLDW